MSDFRELLANLLAKAALERGDCPDCYGSGEIHAFLGIDRGENDLSFHVRLCPRCGGTGWLTGELARPRSCRRCGRVFQPWVNALGEFGYCCKFCTSDWPHARWAANGTLPGQTLALPPTKARSYARGEAQPGVARVGTSANDSVGAGLGLTTGGSSDDQLDRQERTTQPAGQGRRGRPPARRQRAAPAEGPAGSSGAGTDRPSYHVIHRNARRADQPA